MTIMMIWSNKTLISFVVKLKFEYTRIFDIRLHFYLQIILYTYKFDLTKNAHFHGLNKRRFRIHACAYMYVLRI